MEEYIISLYEFAMMFIYRRKLPEMRILTERGLFFGIQ